MEHYRTLESMLGAENSAEKEPIGPYAQWAYSLVEMGASNQ